MAHDTSNPINFTHAEIRCVFHAQLADSLPSLYVPACSFHGAMGEHYGTFLYRLGSTTSAREQIARAIASAMGELLASQPDTKEG